VKKAVRDIVTGKTFDNGVLCSSENSVVVDEPIAEAVKREFQSQGGYFMSTAEMEALARVLVSPQRLPNPALVGKAATILAEKCGITVPGDTRVLLAPLAGVGRDYPLSIEKLCPVLSFYVVKDWHEGCERCKQILRYGGMGHTMSVHSQNDQVILEFGLKKPAFRIVVNSPTTHGSIGLTTGLDPAMTLGCGGYGGNITSDNISPKHLLNIKRVAYEISPAANRFERGAGASAKSPAAPTRPPEPAGIGADVLSRKIDQFLGSRGYRSPEPPASAPLIGKSAAGGEPESSPKPLDFVCEEDVRLALKAGRKLIVSERAIVTPAARDLGEQHRIFSVAPWRG
jgi:acetaldehyde dehydrogenase (acetylating)